MSFPCPKLWEPERQAHVLTLILEADSPTPSQSPSGQAHEHQVPPSLCDCEFLPHRGCKPTQEAAIFTRHLLLPDGRKTVETDAGNGLCREPLRLGVCALLCLCCHSHACCSTLSIQSSTEPFLGFCMEEGGGNPSPLQIASLELRQM